MDFLNSANRSQRTLRIVLFSVILGTLPLYCLGFLLWGTAPRAAGVRTPTPLTQQPGIATATFIPGVATNTPFALPSNTPFLINTPGQFFPTQIPATLFFPTATTYYPPFPTLAPTLTLIPTQAPTLTPLPPTATNTSLPIPTDTLPPTATNTLPLPTETPTETPTATPTDTVIPPGG